MPEQGLGQVCDEYGLRVDNRVSIDLGIFLVSGANPQCGQAVNGFFGRLAPDGFLNSSGIHSEKLVGFDDSSGDYVVVQTYFICIWFEVDVVPEPDKWNDDAQLLCDFSSKCTDSFKDAAFLSRVNKADESYSDEY